MATDAKHTKGSILQYAEEAVFGIAETTFEDLYIEGEPEVSGQFSKSLQPNTLHANAHQVDKPVKVDTNVEGAVAFSVGLTRGAAAGTDAQLCSLMKSAGWEEDSGSDTTVTTATSQTSIVLAADEGDAGRGQVVELDNGNYWPALVSSKATTTVTFACGLPSVTASSNAVNQCHTFYPGAVGPVATSLCFRNITKAMNASNNVTAIYTGCAAATIDDLELTPGILPYLKFTFNAANHSPGTIAAMPANDFTDGPGKKPVDQPIMQFANANASGAIASATGKLLSATIGFGTTTAPIPGQGDTECINGIQGNRQDPGEFMGTLKFLYDADRVSDWEGSNVSKYISITQPSANTTQPCWAFIFPNAHIMEDPVWEPYPGDENMQVLTVKYQANPAGYNSETGEDDQANQPMYILLGTESS